MKLLKTPFICLNIDTEVAGIASNHKKTMQLPILITPRSNWSSHKIPIDYKYDMTVSSHYLKKIRSVVEAGKNLSPEINITITANGVLAFIIEQEEVTTTCQFQNQNILVHEKDEDGNDIQETSCVVNSRKFAAILSQNYFQNAYVSFSIKQDRLFKIEFEVKRNVVLKCLLPTLYQDDE